MQQMREECKKGSGPKKVISEVSAGVGGIVSASDSCEIPRNELQVTKLKSRIRSSSLPASCAPGDELGIVMQQAFMEDSSNMFVRDVKCLREPAIIVATERQLNDLVRFCTPSNQFSILTVDPTFCLGDFDVTVITYRHMMLTSRQTGSPPAMIGPLMIHYKKSFATYLYFSSSLISLRRDLSNIKCFGTDGEQALVDAFRHACPNSLHLICSIHVRKNTKAKLQDLGVNEGVRNLILDDIFGRRRGCHYSEGLVDTASNKEFDEVFQSLTKKWQALDLSDDTRHRFIQWFQKHKSGVIKSSMLRPIREKAGLGNPPCSFTTNASESVNAMLKMKVDYKRNDLPVFLEKVKELIQEQDEEINKAVVGRGKYVVNSEFKKFVKTENEWFVKMKEAERVRHLQRFSSFKLPETSQVSLSLCGSTANTTLRSNTDGPSSSSNFTPSLQSFSSVTRSQNKPSQFYSSSEAFPHTLGDSDSSSVSGEDETQPPKKSVRRQLFQRDELSVDYTEFTKEVSVPDMVLQSMWKKASELITTPNMIAPAPGLDLKSHTVVSASGKRPHMVSVKKTGQYVCDKGCGNWNSLSICSHTVAVAEINGELSKYISWFVKAKKKPSVTKLVTTGMPDGRGRKGGKVAQRKKTVTVTSRTPISVVSGTESQVSNAADNSCSSTSVRMPSHPPPLIHYTPQSLTPLSEPFVLCFVTGNISVCYGCRQKYPKPCQPPDDLCVRHKEWREFFPPGSGTAQTRFSNVYYHCNTPCIQARCPAFSPELLQIPAFIAAQLLPVHTEYLASRMERTM